MKCAHRACTLLLAFLLIGTARTLAQSYTAHLVFEGGGVRGIAYAGALEVMEEARMLEKAESTAGTSVGGLVAVLYAVGYSPRELMALLADLKIQRFNDGRWLFFGGLARTNRRFGWYRGERFEDWVADAIERKTGKRDLTFGELHAMREKNARYKDPTLFATDLTLQRTVQFSHQASPDMPLHLAARITMSVPLYFSAVFLDANMKPVRRPARTGNYRVFVDGGIAANYPLSFYRPDDANRRVLGFKLERPEQVAVGPASTAGITRYRISSLRDYVAALYNFSIEAANPDPAPNESSTTIYISTGGIGPRVRKMRKEDVQLLIESGRESARAFLKKPAR